MKNLVKQDNFDRKAHKRSELRFTPANGVPVANFTLAVIDLCKSKGEREADFIRIVAWRKLAKSVQTTLQRALSGS